MLFSSVWCITCFSKSKEGKWGYVDYGMPQILTCINIPWYRLLTGIWYKMCFRKQRDFTWSRLRFVSPSHSNQLTAGHLSRLPSSYIHSLLSTICSFGPKEPLTRMCGSRRHCVATCTAVGQREFTTSPCHSSKHVPQDGLPLTTGLELSTWLYQTNHRLGVRNLTAYTNTNVYRISYLG